MKYVNKAIIPFVFLFLSSNAFPQDFILLPVGHSHNDYTRDKPLHEALSYGFTSIEVDVFLDDNRMVVTHADKALPENPSAINCTGVTPLSKGLSHTSNFFAIALTAG